MAPLLVKRHQREAAEAKRRQREIISDEREDVPTQTAGGDPRYRLPAIGLNAGAMPGTRPDVVAIR